MKALLAIDGSIHALHAARVLVDLVKHCPGISAHVLNVQQPLPYQDLLSLEKQQGVERLILERGTELTNNACLMLKAASIPFAVQVVCDDPVAAIVRVAREQACDFILMGTRGLNPVAGLALGSVANKVLHLADRPVTLVK